MDKVPEKNQANNVEVWQNLSIQLLGTFSVSVDGQPVPDDSWRLRKVKSLVKLLALAHGHRLHRDQIIDVLWPDSDFKGANNLFYQTVHAVRQILAPSGKNGQRFLVMQNEFLSLCPDLSFSTDVDRFQELAAKAHARHQLEDVQAALNCYTDDLLPEDLYEEWVQPRRDALRDEYFRLLIELSSIYQDRQEYEAAITALRKIIAADKTNEEAHALIIRLHVLLGQRQQAVRQYLALKETLHNELGILPEVSTTRLYEEILSGQAEVRSPPPDSSRLNFPRHNLPSRLTSFIGHEKEIHQILHLVAENRLVTLTGAGGVGKTRLAMEVLWGMLGEGQADVDDLKNRSGIQFSDGFWLVELGALSDPDLIPSQIASIFHLQEEPNRPLLATIKNYLRDKKALLLFDNCEHLVGDCARIVEGLLKDCPGLRVLATSREVLGSEGEQTYIVPSLTIPDSKVSFTEEELQQSEAVRLFVERAKKVSPKFEIRPENVNQIAQVCQRLDGIPLALEFAAARMGVLSIEQIASRLDDRFRLLTGGSRTAIPRHQTMRACMDWSYEMLCAQERVSLQRLSVFSGGWTLEAAEAICADPDVIDPLAQLVQKSLVVLDQNPGSETRESIEPRYSMYETVRQYALEKLIESGEGEEIRDRHLDYYLSFAEKTRPKLNHFNLMIGPKRLMMELGNIRNALRWAAGTAQEERLAKGLRLANASAVFIQQVTVGEGLAWLQPGLERLSDHPGWAQVRAQALLTKSLLMLEGYDGLDVTVPIAEKSAQLFQQCGDLAGYGIAKIVMGCMLQHFDSDRAIQLLDEGYAISREAGDEAMMAFALSSKANLLSEMKQFDLAIQCLLECRELGKKLSDNWIELSSLLSLGFIAIHQGEVEKASEYLRLGSALGDKVEEWQWENGKSYFNQVKANLAYRQEDFKQMEQHINAMTEYQSFYHPEDSLAKAWSLRLLGIAVKRQGDWKRAGQYFMQSIAIARMKEDTYGILSGLSGWAESIGLAGRELAAVKIIGAVETLFAAFTKVMNILDQEEFDRSKRQLQQALSAEEFAQAWQEGGKMNLEQTLAYALKELG